MSSRCAPPVTSYFLVQLRWDDQTQVKAYHHWLHKLNYYSIGRAVAGAPFWIGFVTFFNTYQFFYGCSFQTAVYIKNKPAIKQACVIQSTVYSQLTKGYKHWRFLSTFLEKSKETKQAAHLLSNCFQEYSVSEQIFNPTCINNHVKACTYFTWPTMICGNCTPQFYRLQGLPDYLATGLLKLAHTEQENNYF